MTGLFLQRRCWAVALLFSLASVTVLYAQQNCTIASNFNGTPISGGDYIWFTAVIKVQGLGSQPVTLNFTNSTINFSVNGVPQVINVPNAQVNFSPQTTLATTSFAGNTWTTNLPSSGLAGNDYLTGVEIQVPAGGWPGGIQPVTWTGTFSSTTQGLGVQWQWAAAVYTVFNTNYNALGVKPVDDNHASQYQNSDPAGTPENYKQYVTGGAQGGGGSNYTGSLSATASCTVNPAQGPPPNVACNPTSSLSVLLQGSRVTAYIPNGNWMSTNNGVQVVPLEPTGTPASIATPNVVNSCASNSTTGQTVCTANNTDVYLISGSTLDNTLTSGSTGTTAFSGGMCNNCGVVINPVNNVAAIVMGLASAPSGSGIQFLNLNNNTFSTPIPANDEVSEDILWDTTRNLILSPGEPGVYDLFQVGSGGGLTEFANPISGAPVLDSAGEDCGTGIGLSTIEFTDQLLLTDLTQAQYNNTTGTWSAPVNVTTLPEYVPYERSESGTDGVAVAPGTHLGLVIGEFPTPPSSANAIIAINLPSTSGSGTPQLQDYVVAVIPNDPAGDPFSLGCDPHTTAAYVSPNSGKAIGLVTDYGSVTCYSGGSPQYLALIDLQGLLSAPRVPGEHLVQPGYDLVGNGIVKFLSALTATPTLAVSASPSSLSTSLGNQGASTITTTGGGGFDAAVSFSASGLPSGATVGFNPSTISPPGSGSSTMTISVGSTTTPGTYPITVTASGGGLQQSTTVTLTVTTGPNFTVSASPSSLSIGQGYQGNTTITTAISGGFNSQISLSASGVPPGVNVNLNPNNINAPGSSSSTMSIQVNSNTPAGTYPITVTGNGGGLQRATTVTLTVTVPSISLSASPSALTVSQGNQGTSTITVVGSGGFNGQVQLQANGLPGGVNVSFNPNNIPAPGSGITTMMISVSSNTTAGTYPITVTANGGGNVQAMTTLMLTVLAVDFSMTLTPPSQTVSRGQEASYTVTLTPSNGFDGSVSFQQSGCPASSNCSFNPQSVIPPGNSTFTVATQSGTQTGTYNLTITAKSGNLQHTVTVSLMVE